MAKPKPPTSPYVPVDAWTLRCLYNKSDYAARIASKDFTVLLRETGKPRNGSITVQEYYGLAAGRVLMLRLQWFEDEFGGIFRSGLKDPKQMYLEGFDYHLHSGNTRLERVRREPEKALPTVWLQKKYGVWRTYKCDRWGPVEARRRVARLSEH